MTHYRIIEFRRHKTFSTTIYSESNNYSALLLTVLQFLHQIFRSRKNFLALAPPHNMYVFELIPRCTPSVHRLTFHEICSRITLLTYFLIVHIEIRWRYRKAHELATDKNLREHWKFRFVSIGLCYLNGRKKDRTRYPECKAVRQTSRKFWRTTKSVNTSRSKSEIYQVKQTFKISQRRLVRAIRL